jgi:hypothetical protein
MAALIVLGCVAGVGAGLLAGLIGIGGGIVVVPVVYYGLVSSGIAPDEAVHVAVATSLASILPAAIVSFLVHRRAGNTDFAFLRDWGPGIAIGVVAAQLAAPHLRGAFMTAIFAVMCLVFAIRFAVPQRFHPMAERGYLWVRRDRRRHPDKYRNDAVRAADAQEHRPGSRSRHRGERASHNCGGARIESETSAGAGQHRHHDVGLHCPGPGCCGLAWCTIGLGYLRGASEPGVRGGPVGNRRHHAVFESGLAHGILQTSLPTRPDLDGNIYGT